VWLWNHKDGYGDSSSVLKIDVTVCNIDVYRIFSSV
jgi:hypothetical protein